MNLPYGQDISSYPSGHPVGSCSRFKNDAFIWIPKNASGTLRYLFGEQMENFYTFDVETYWVFLRDPVSRWRSGITEYIYRNPDDHILILDTIHQIEFDEHTAPQTSFLQYRYAYDSGRTNYISIDNKTWLSGLINDLGIQDKEVSVANDTIGNKNKTAIGKSVDRVMSPTFINKLREYYSDDIKLLEKTKETNDTTT